jgi:hypothetical protein
MKESGYYPAGAQHDPRAPWTQPDLYGTNPHRCDWECGNEVDEQEQVCDACLVDNAKACGDWDEESLAAQQRINTTTMNNHDNFDALWDQLKATIRANREPQAVYTMGGVMDRDHARFDTSAPDADEGDRPMVSLHMGWERGNAMAYARREDLLNIAAHCIQRAAQMEQP